MLESRLKVYGVGIAVKDKELASDEIEVYPVEHLPLEDNKLGEAKTVSVNKPDSFGKQISVQVERENIIVARWLPIYGSNRVTPPDIIKNETVLLIQYGDTDQFYWVDMKNELGLRRKETALFLFGNEPNFGVDLGFNNSYWYRVSSHGKKVEFHTSDNDGELCTYDIRIDTKNGYFELIDGRGNYIKLDSSIDTLFANINKDIVVRNGRDIDVQNGRDVKVNNARNIDISNGNDVSVTNGNDITVDNGSNITINNGGNITINNGGDTSLDTGGSLNVTTGSSITINGGADIKITSSGPTTVNSGGPATLSASGPVTVSGAAISMSGGGASMSLGGGKASIGAGGQNGLKVISDLIAAVISLTVDETAPKGVTSASVAQLTAIKAIIDGMI